MNELHVKSKLFNQQDVLEVKEDIATPSDIPSTADITQIANTAIQADKDVLSKIVYDSENNKIIFPNNIFPLHIGTEEDNYFIDFENHVVLDESNVEISNSS